MLNKALTFIDSSVFDIIDYFTNQMNAYLSLALKLGTILACVGIIWQCLQMVFGTLESRKFLVGSITKWFLFIFILNFYPAMSKGLKDFAIEMGTYVSGSSVNQITTQFGNYLETLEKGLTTKQEDLAIFLENLNKSRKDMLDGTFQEYPVDNYLLYYDYTEETIKSKEKEKQEIDAVINSIDTDNPIGAAKIINSLKSVLIIDEKDVISKYKLDISMKDSNGVDTGYLSPNAMLRISVLSAQIMWEKMWQEDVIPTWEDNARKGAIKRKQLKDFPFNKIFDLILCFFCMLFEVIITCVELIQYVMCIIEFTICITFGVILVPTLLFDGLKDMAMKLLPSLLAQTVKLAMITICMFFCCYTYMNICTTTIPDTSGFNLMTFCYVIFTVLLTFALCSNAPKLASALLTGQPQLSMGEFVQTAGAIAGGAMAASKMASSAVSAGRSAVGGATRATFNRLGDAAAMVGGASGAIANLSPYASQGEKVAAAIGGAAKAGLKRTGNRIAGAAQNAATYKGKSGGMGGGSSGGGNNRWTSNNPMGEATRNQNDVANQHSMNYGDHVTKNGTKSTLGEYLKDQYTSAGGVKKGKADIHPDTPKAAASSNPTAFAGNSSNPKQTTPPAASPSAPPSSPSGSAPIRSANSTCSYTPPMIEDGNTIYSSDYTIDDE